MQNRYEIDYKNSAVKTKVGHCLVCLHPPAIISLIRIFQALHKRFILKMGVIVYKHQHWVKTLQFLFSVDVRFPLQHMESIYGQHTSHLEIKYYCLNSIMINLFMVLEIRIINWKIRLTKHRIKQGHRMAEEKNNHCSCRCHVTLPI